jgi:hypothetical protein
MSLFRELTDRITKRKTTTTAASEFEKKFVGERVLKHRGQQIRQKIKEKRLKSTKHS